MKKNIYLVGMPASGKTTTALKLAKILEVECMDTDAEIEKIAGITTAQIFENYGEDYFRKLERDVLLRSFELSGWVVATGGGLPAFFDNMELVIKNGIAIYIQTPLSQIEIRIRNDTQKRPLFPNENLKETLQEKFAQRERFYGKAQIKIKPDADLNELSFYLKSLP